MSNLVLKASVVAIMAVVLPLVGSSCQDELPYDEGTVCEEGLPATVTVKLAPDDMSQFTRALVDDEESTNYIHDLFLAVYNNDGTRLCCKYYDDLENNSNVDYDNSTLRVSFTAESAVNATIVAVANMAYENRDYIEYFMNSAFSTMARFQTIVYNRVDPSDVNLYSSTFLMSGYYSDKSADEDHSSPTTVSIQPGDQTLSGTIYLKRLYAYNKFRIKAADNVTLKLNTWKVGNVPPGCYLMEHNTNAFSYKSSYKESNESHSFFSDTDDSNYRDFEFYQLENLHTGIDYSDIGGGDWIGIKDDSNPQNMYVCRERQYKDAGGRSNGVYKSLTSHSDPDYEDSNNNASYVVINADIDYYYVDNEYNRAHPDEAVAVSKDNTTEPLIHRVANVDYVIHLGYCLYKNGNTPTVDTAKDFNCQRNSKYKYNVTINGVNNVVLEAESSTTENQPGAHGSVTDVYEDEVELDSHYCTFNVKFSDDERREGLQYHMLVPYDGVDHYFNRDKADDYKSDWEDDELFTWIKFYPTTDENTLAEYNGGKDLWSIEDMCKLEKENPYDADADGNKWYTVFIDEYVYHKDDKNGEETSWPKYTNQNNRKATFLNRFYLSNDSLSNYSFCKYEFSQKSIQTYYNNLTEGETALGVEHTDETYCLNMAWNSTQPTYGSSQQAKRKAYYNLYNGRYNIWNYLGLTSFNWADVISETVPCTVKADSNGGNIGTSHPAANYPVCLPKDVAQVGPAGRPSPNDARGFYANALCMNRNRDLNGDGTIEANEVRWYIPTSYQYMQIAIGQGELPDPLIRFSNHSQSELETNVDDSSSGRKGTYYYHHITSDYQYFWAEQCVNNGDGPLTRDLCQCYAVRCVRNLGHNPSDEADLNSQSTSPIAKTYEYDSSTRTFTLDKYTSVSLRGYSAGPLRPHTVADISSRPYEKFVVASNLCKNISDDYVAVDGNGNLTFANCSTPYNHDRTIAWTKSLRKNGICGKYYQNSDMSDFGTWRVPNLKEMAMLYMEGLMQSDNAYALSCTYDYFNSYLLVDETLVKGLYMGYNNQSDRKVLARDIIDTGSTIRVRCVKDVL